MTIAFALFVLLGLATLALLIAAVGSSLPAITDLRHARNQARQPIRYCFKISEPVRTAQPVTLSIARKHPVGPGKTIRASIKRKAPQYRPAAAAA